ncbi:MAG: septum formation initiator family protein [Bacillota bacterium]
MARGTKRRLAIRRRFLVYAFVLAFGLLGAVYISQESKLNGILSEQETLRQQSLALTNEADRIERMIEYAKTKDYALQYAREKIGYMLPGDIRFHLED